MGQLCNSVLLNLTFSNRVPSMTEIAPRITVNPAVCGGRPCIRGYRLRVKDVLELLAAGASRQEILEDYAFLEDADITAALQYAAREHGHRIVLAAE